LGTVAFVLVRGAAVVNAFPFWAFSGLYFLQNGTYVEVVQFFHSQSRWIPAGCSYSRNSSYPLDLFPRLGFVAVGTLLVWSSRKGIGIVVFSTLTVLGREVLLM
jgi:hypothetical protein